MTESEKTHVKLLHEEAAHYKTLGQRDYAHQLLDDMTQALQDLTGEYFGEHSSDNDPWELALDHLQQMADKHHRSNAKLTDGESASRSGPAPG